MFYVYILKSRKDGNLYIGKTNNLERRIKEHNSGQVSSTKSRRPFVILKTLACETELEARKLELECKKGYKRESFKKGFR
ncbi:GIY-YIG nuclease family protein [Candidatus Parcubacteria bacterium]|nr:MAG: GIY-YIG nuclease family protein [Candidatus Parcubacteria bacterium]